MRQSPGGNIKKLLTAQAHLPYVGPLSLWIIVFVFAPMGVIVYFSFVRTGVFGEIIHTFTLENYRILFETQHGVILARSLFFAFGTNVICLLIGYPLAYWIARSGGKFKLILLGLVIVPSWTCYLLRLYGLRLLAGDPGIINNVLLNLHLISCPVKMLFTPFAVVLGLVHIWLPFMVLPIYASLEGLDPSFLEAAMDLGATPFRRFFTVTLPLTKGGIFAGTILTFIPAFGDWLSPLVLGGNKVLMAGSLVQHYFIVVGNFSAGSSIATALTAIVALIMYLCIKLGGEEAIERIV